MKNFAVSSIARRTAASFLSSVSFRGDNTPTITTIPSPANEIFGFTAILGTTGDGTQSVTSSTPKVCSVASNGLTVTFVGFGTCTLTPSVTQGPNHFGASGSAQSFPVQEASHGYWLVGAHGSVFAFGDAVNYGGTGRQRLSAPIVGLQATADGQGYWLVASDGGVFNFGDATFYGSTGAETLTAPVVGMAATGDGSGYWLVTADGRVFNFGDAPNDGGMSGTHLNGSIIAGTGF